jgi:hypothetical protein
LKRGRFSESSRTEWAQISTHVPQPLHLSSSPWYSIKASYASQHIAPQNNVERLYAGKCRPQAVPKKPFRFRMFYVGGMSLSGMSLSDSQYREILLKK